MIGLGAMGLPMSRNMVLRGQDVVGFDLAPERVLTAAEVGVTSARRSRAADPGRAGQLPGDVRPAEARREAVEVLRPGRCRAGRDPRRVDLSGSTAFEGGRGVGSSLRRGSLLTRVRLARCTASECDPPPSRSTGGGSPSRQRLISRSGRARACRRAA
ncbi:NAD(P)-binding domain-containing protein [Micromonospora sp. SL4-19]|uniref:NAD(P)-binding domain-containing protein n=1 Tax=Micromonospora sp. SL4-19 TaxID=3399129 RepID=UPI003A4E3EAB